MRSLLAVLLLVAVAQARIRIVCPPPAVGGDDENQIPSAASPCGGGVDMASPTITFTDFGIGQQSILFLETVSVEDSPFSIRLCNRTDCSYVLVDHIPHLNFGRQVLTSSPASRFESRPFLLTIPIPDIKCDECFIQLLQIGRESVTANEDCTFGAAQTGSCTRTPNVQYVACAPVKITGTTPFASNPNPNTNGLDYTVPSGWPHSDRTAGSYRQRDGNDAAWDWPTAERNTQVYGYRVNNPGGTYRNPSGTCNKMFTSAQVNFKSAFYDPAQFTPSGGKAAPASGLSAVLAAAVSLAFAALATLF